MNIVYPSGRAGQGLALLLSFIFLAFLWAGLAAPLLNFFDERNAKLNQEIMIADHLAAQAADLPRLRTASASQQPNNVPANNSVEGATEAIAAANLQKQIEELASAASVGIESVEPIPATSENAPAKRVGILIRTNSPYSALVQLLASMRQQTPVLSVEDFELHSAGGSATPAGSFTSTFTVHAPWNQGGLK